MKKIYVFVESNLGHDLIGCALAEDGIVLAQHLSSSRDFVRLDMGLTSTRKHRTYDTYYPGGYELVDLVGFTDDQLLAHAGFQEANVNYEESQRNDRSPKGGRRPRPESIHSIAHESGQRHLDL